MFIHAGLPPSLLDFLEHSRGDSCKSAIYLHSKILYHRNLPRIFLRKAKPPILKPMAVILLFFSSFSSFLCLFTHHCGSLQLKLLPAFTCSATYFLFVSSGRSSRVLFLTGPSVTRVRRLFSKHSRNLLDCLSPAVLSLWQIRNGLSCPDNQDFHHEMV